MNVQMMEGLVGASTNIRLSGASMSVYRQASAAGDTEKMRRSLQYTGECAEKAVKCQEKLDKGMKAEATAAREQAKLEREAAIAKRREERRRAEEGGAPDRLQEADRISLSAAAKAALEKEAAGKAAREDIDPVIYTATGETAAPPEAEPTVSASA